MKTLIVTRHPSLVKLIRERGLAPKGTPVLQHVTADVVRGCHVIGVLPLHLAALAARVTEVPIAMTQKDREDAQAGDLSLARLRRIAGEPMTYAATSTPNSDEEAVRLAAELGAVATPEEKAERAYVWVFFRGSQNGCPGPIKESGVSRYQDDHTGTACEVDDEWTRVRVRTTDDQGQWSRWVDIRPYSVEYSGSAKEREASRQRTQRFRSL